MYITQIIIKNSEGIRFSLLCFRRNSESEVATAAVKGGSRKTSLSRDSSEFFTAAFKVQYIHITTARATLLAFTYLSTFVPSSLFPEPSRTKKKMSKNTDPFENIAITLERF